MALLFGAVAPPGIAVAQEADQGREGTAAPEQAPPDSAGDPDFDPGGETDLPIDVGERDSGDGSGEGAPVDSEPVDDPDAPPAPADDPAAPAPDTTSGADVPTAPVESAPPAEPTTSPVAPAPAPAPAPPAAAPEPAPATAGPAPERERRAKPHKPLRDRAPQRRAHRVTTPALAPVPVPAVDAPAETITQVEPVAEATAPTPTPTPSERARPGQDSHVVRPGESLSLIAIDLLGPDATDTQIATEVDRLYRLNRDRIGDDPNLILVGMVLRLR